MIQLTRVGYVVKSIGLQGQLQIALDEIPNLENVSYLFIDIEGSKVPFYIESQSFKNKPQVKLEQISSPEAVSPLISQDIYIENTAEVLNNLIQEKGQEAANTLIGFDLHDEEEGHLGSVNEFIDYGMHQVLNILSRENTIVAIPFHEDLILEIDNSSRKILMKLPKGLF